MANSTRHRASTASGTLRGFQVAAALTVVCILVQFATAGRLLSQDESALPWHAGGAIVLHVLSAAATLAAFLHWRATRGPLWPTVVSALVFVAGFVQAWAGDEGLMLVHVPLAMVVSSGAVAVLLWAFLPAARRA